MGNATPQRRHGAYLTLALACSAWLGAGAVQAQTSDVYRWIEMLPAAKSKKDDKPDKPDARPERNDKLARPAAGSARRPEPVKVAAPAAISAPQPASPGAPALPSPSAAVAGASPEAAPGMATHAADGARAPDAAAPSGGSQTALAAPGTGDIAAPPAQTPAAEPPAAAAEPPPILLKIAHREPLAVTAEALRSGVKEGQVRARLTIETDGRVSRVEILRSTPRGVFDRSVVRALQQWRYEPIRESQTAEIELAFKLDE